MKNQQLFYKRVTPVSFQRHSDWSIENTNNYDFARTVNSVPLVAVEMPLAAREYAVVFAGNNDAVMPVALLGLEGDENVYVKDNGEWDSKYIPAFVRRYPFVFSLNEEEDKFTLCIDESWSGCNEEGLGNKLFNEKEEHTPYLDNILKFLQEYQIQFTRTKAFCEKLKELKLLEPMQAQFTLPAGDKRSLVGFMAINREKLKELPAKKLAELIKTDELELIYSHLQSMNNISLIAENFVHDISHPAEIAGTEEPSVAAQEEQSAKPASTEEKKESKTKKSKSSASKKTSTLN